MAGPDRRKRSRLNLVQPVAETEEPMNDDGSGMPRQESGEVEKKVECRPHRSPLKSFLCPLTLDIMFDPILDSHGNTYERRALMKWIKEHRTSPVSRQPLSDCLVIPNIALRETIHEFMGSEWVSEREREQRVQSLAEPTLNVPTSSSTLRAKVDCYLRGASSELYGLDLTLNDEGCCAFRYDDITFVLDVPEKVGLFFFYTKNLLPGDLEGDLEESARNRLHRKALEFNFLQGMHTAESKM
jgi:hypothetical protein